MGLGSRGVGRDDAVRAVKASGRKFDHVSVERAIAQRRAAGGAEVALGDRRRAEGGRLAAGPGKVLVPDVGERNEWTADRLLAHPAMAKPYLHRARIDGETHGAALAASSENRFSVLRHAHSIRRQASCSIASASPPAKMKSPTPAASSAVSCSPGRPAR